VAIVTEIGDHPSSRLATATGDDDFHGAPILLVLCMNSYATFEFGGFSPVFHHQGGS
jgi:hypothetical protein